MNDEKYLRNGWKVRYVGPTTEGSEGSENHVGHIHGVGHAGFSVRYEDGLSAPYLWRDQTDFSVLSKNSGGETHDSVAQDILLTRLDRDNVEEYLRRYRCVLAEDLDEIHDDPATPEMYRAGLRSASRRLRKAADL